MLVKEFFKMLESTKFQFNSKEDKHKTDVHTSIGLGSFGYYSNNAYSKITRHSDTFVFKILKEIDGETFVKKEMYSSVSTIEDYILDLEIVEISRITLKGNIHITGYDNSYPSYPSSIELIVR